MEKHELGSGDSIAGRPSVSPPSKSVLVEIYTVRIGYSEDIAHLLPARAHRLNEMVEFEPVFRIADEALAFALIISRAHSVPAFVVTNFYTYNSTEFRCVVDGQRRPGYDYEGDAFPNPLHAKY